MFRQRMSWSKLKNGYGPACFRLATAIHNRRFYEKTSRVMDNDSRSFIYNLKRALIFKQFENECSPEFENPFLTAVEHNHELLLNFNRARDWTKIDAGTINSPIQLILPYYSIGTKNKEM